MDPVSLAGTAVGFLAPYLGKLVGKVTDKVGDSLAEASLPAMKRLYEAVKGRLGSGTYAGKQLQGVEERPESDGRRQALQNVLVKVLQEDHGFAVELERLVSEAANEARVTASDAGIVAGRDVRQHGRYVAGRDLSIGGTTDDTQ